MNDRIVKWLSVRCTQVFYENFILRILLACLFVFKRDSKLKQKKNLTFPCNLPSHWGLVQLAFLGSFSIMNDSVRNCSENCSHLESVKFNNELCGRFTVFVTEDVPRPIIIANCLINTILLIVSVFANSLLLTAVRKTPSLRYPSVVFLCGLAVSDLAVGLIVQPLFIAIELLKIHGHPKGDCSLETAFISLAFTLCGVSFGNVTSISFDRYLAIQYPLRYRTIVTLPRVVFVIILCWLTSSIVVSSLVIWDINAFSYVVVVVATLFLSASTAIHIKIYKIVRRHRIEIRAQEQAVQTTAGFNMERFKKTAMNTFLVYYFLLLCYAPFSIGLLLHVVSHHDIKHPIAWKLTNTTVFLNSALNPFLYCWRLPAIRGPVIILLKKLFSPPEQWIRKKYILAVGISHEDQAVSL